MKTKTEEPSAWLRLLHWFKTHAQSWWAAPFMGLLALLDTFFLVVPTDSLVISLAALNPKRWLYLSTCVALGSALGSTLLAYLVSIYGMSVLLWIKPDIESMSLWIWSQEFIHHYGRFALFLIALSPFANQPVVALAALAARPILHIALWVVLGRFLKYLFLTWIATHMPHLLRRLWGIQGEIDKLKE